MMVYADALAGVFAFALLGLFFYGPWQNTITDIARQIVFESRDAVFDLANDGKLNFDSQEYKTIRNSFNQLIRFAHELNWVRFVLFMKMDRPDTRDGKPNQLSLKAAVDRIEDREVRSAVQTHIKEARYAMIGMMAAKSLPFMFAAAAVAACAAFAGGLTKILQLFSRAESLIGDRVQAEAERA